MIYIKIEVGRISEICRELYGRFWADVHVYDNTLELYVSNFYGNSHKELAQKIKIELEQRGYYPSEVVIKNKWGYALGTIGMCLA